MKEEKKKCACTKSPEIQLSDIKSCWVVNYEDFKNGMTMPTPDNKKNPINFYIPDELPPSAKKFYDWFTEQARKQEQIRKMNYVNGN